MACVGIIPNSLAIQPTGVTLISTSIVEVTTSVIVSLTAQQYYLLHLRVT